MPLLFSPFNRTIALFAALIAAAAAAAYDRPGGPADIHVSFSQAGDEEFRVDYTLKRKTKALAFGPLVDGYREERWRLQSADFEIVRNGGGDVLRRIDGKPFRTVSVTAGPGHVRIPKNYQPIAQYGPGGALIYNGHFWPVTETGARTNSDFTFHPALGSQVVAFGERKDALARWRSPMAHPAFVYLGPLSPVETPDVMAIIDPAAPGWIREEFDALTPTVFAHLTKIFGFSLQAKPNLFLSAPLGGEEGRLSYAGDALPGQFQITLRGGAWASRSDKGLDIFRRSTIHEAVHLWQFAARPSDRDIPAWIHEGAADAIAAEAMRALGLWTPAQFDAALQDAKVECAGEMRKGALRSAERRGAYLAVYACGHVIAAAASVADGRSVADFWRDYIAEARRKGGYSEALFLDLVAERTGDEAFRRRVASFVRTESLDPERMIEGLFGGAPLASAAAR